MTTSNLEQDYIIRQEHSNHMKINIHSSGIKIEVSKTGRWLEKKPTTGSFKTLSTLFRKCPMFLFF